MCVQGKGPPTPAPLQQPAAKRSKTRDAFQGTRRIPSQPTLPSAVVATELSSPPDFFREIRMHFSPSEGSVATRPRLRQSRTNIPRPSPLLQRYGISNPGTAPLFTLRCRSQTLNSSSAKKPPSTRLQLSSLLQLHSVLEPPAQPPQHHPAHVPTQRRNQRPA